MWFFLPVSRKFEIRISKSETNSKQKGENPKQKNGIDGQ